MAVFKRKAFFSNGQAEPDIPTSAEIRVQTAVATYATSATIPEKTSLKQTEYVTERMRIITSSLMWI